LKSQRQNGGVCKDDLRGKHKKKKTDDYTVELVKKHIMSFPSNVSHYTRSHSDNRLYLASNLSISKMYELHLEDCLKENVEPAKLWLYRHVFNTMFNFTFKLPRKDTCKKCDIYKVKTDAESNEVVKMQLTKEHDVHLAKAELARTQLKVSKQNIDSKSETFSFDLQKVFSIPHLTTNETYYCRQLSVYNLGIHSTTTNKVIMNVWHEGVASRGAQDIASCLLSYCSRKAAEGIEKVTAYSDACGGQNRNSKVVAMWMYIVQTTPIKEINHKFMVSGHSYLPNDSDFGVIERKVSRTSQMYVPSDWYKAISTCNRKNPFEVNEMSQESMVSVAPIMKVLTIRKHDDMKQKVEWLKIQWIQIRKENPKKMFYKYTVQEEVPFFSVCFEKKSKVRPVLLNDVVLSKLYVEPRVLSQEKFKDIQKLLKYVPPLHHPFFESLAQATTNATEKHLYADELLYSSGDEDKSDVEGADEPDSAEQDVQSVSKEVASSVKEISERTSATKGS